MPNIFITLVAVVIMTGCMATAKVQINVDQVTAQALKKPLIVVVTDTKTETLESNQLKEKFIRQFASELQAECIDLQMVTIRLPELVPGATLRAAVVKGKPIELLQIGQSGLHKSNNYFNAMEISLTQLFVDTGREAWKANVYLPAKNPEQLALAVKDLKTKMRQEGVLKSLCNGR